MPDSNSLDFTTAMTLEAWVRPTALGGYRSAIMKEAPTNLVYALYPETSPAKPSFQVQMGTRLRGVQGPSQLPINTWSHLAATFDGNMFKIFVNGTDESTLEKGPGRDLQSYLPGEGKLIYIAGHRTTYLAPFSAIDTMRKGDSSSAPNDRLNSCTRVTIPAAACKAWRQAVSGPVSTPKRAITPSPVYWFAMPPASAMAPPTASK